MSQVLDLKHLPEPEPEEEVVEPAADFGFAPQTVSWSATHTIGPRQRSREYMALGGVAIAGAVVSWWQSSWLTFAVVVLGIVAWELYNRFPATHEVHVNDKGIIIDGYRHAYQYLKSFDIHELPDGSRHLSVLTTRWHFPHLSIPLGDQDPASVHATLSQYLLQDDHAISPLDWWMKK